MALYFWGAMLFFIALMLLAMARERRHMRRQNLDQFSMVPWPLVMVISMTAAVISLVLALKNSL